MKSVYIPNLLQQPHKSKSIEIKEHLAGLESLTPVRGEVKVTHQGTYLEVQGNVVVIVTLSCHRCLQNYNFRLEATPQELIWLESPHRSENLPLEREVAIEDLVENLDPKGHFYPHNWLYQQLCLLLPQRQLCREDCAGIEINASSMIESSVDSRWATLAELKSWLPE